MNANMIMLASNDKAKMVTVNDQQAPAVGAFTFLAPPDMILYSIEGVSISASQINMGTPTVQSTTPVQWVNSYPSTFNLGLSQITWTATDAIGNTITAVQTVTVTQDQLDIPALSNLPPDPGVAGEQTLEGIDFDGDGVRDDIQRWIALTFPNSEKSRAALRQDAKAHQRYLLDAADPTQTYKNALEMHRATECWSYIHLDPDIFDMTMELHALYLNTYLRSKTSMQADRHLSGGMFSTLPNEKQGCDFNPDTLAN